MRWSEIIKETTAAGSIATVPGNGKSTKGSIGAGFDPNGHKGIYDAAERKKKKTESTAPLLRR